MKKKLFRKINVYKVLYYFFKLLYIDISENKYEYKSLGTENQKKKFLVFGQGLNKNDGLMYVMINVLTYINYFTKKKYTLVIDMQNNDNQYLDGIEIGKENAWEYFFEQPFGYTLDSIKDSKNVYYIKSKFLYNPFSFVNRYIHNHKFTSIHTKPAILKEFKKNYNKYINFSPTAKQFIESEHERIFNGKGRVLGVLARGTDYFTLKPRTHFIQPNPDEILAKSLQYMQNYNCDYLYLATEDENIYQLFKTTLNDKLLVNSQYRFDKNNMKEGEWISTINTGRERDKYHLGLEYISSLYNLSKCQCFVGGITSGTLVTLFMTEGFEHQFLFDLGKYR